MTSKEAMDKAIQQHQKIESLTSRDTSELVDILKVHNEIIYSNISHTREVEDKVSNMKENLDKVLQYYSYKKEEDLKRAGAEEALKVGVERLKVVGSVIILLATVGGVLWSIFQFSVNNVL